MNARFSVDVSTYVDLYQLTSRNQLGEEDELYTLFLFLFRLLNYSSRAVKGSLLG